MTLNRRVLLQFFNCLHLIDIKKFQLTCFEIKFYNDRASYKMFHLRVIKDNQTKL